MRAMFRFAIVAFLFSVALPLVAQEHYTEGPVWVISFYRTKTDQFDNYMKYLRANYLVTTAESKKQGLILDSKIYVKALRDANDWNVAIASQYPSFAKALDFNAADDDKARAISAAHYKTTDRDRQSQMTAPRLEMRDFVGTEMIREVTLKPIMK